MRLIIRDEVLAASEYVAQYIIGMACLLAFMTCSKISRSNKHICANRIKTFRPRTTHWKQSIARIQGHGQETSCRRNFFQKCDNIQYGLSLPRAQQDEHVN